MAPEELTKVSLSLVLNHETNGSSFSIGPNRLSKFFVSKWIEIQEKIIIFNKKGSIKAITNRAIEITGTINADRQLVLDGPLPNIGPTPVRVIILLYEEAAIEEKEWLQTAASNSAFDFLKKT